LDIQPKPVVAIIGAGAGEDIFSRENNSKAVFFSFQPVLLVQICFDRMVFMVELSCFLVKASCRTIEYFSIYIIFDRQSKFSFCQVQLSKQPTKKLENLLLRDTSYFKKAKIELLLNTTVTNVYCPSQNIAYRTIGDQLRSLQYDYLVLATGLTPRKLPSSLSGSNLRNIFYLRSLEDADRLVSKLELIEKLSDE